MPDTKRSFVDRFFKNKEGRVVIFQSPNWPLYGWIFFRLMMRLTDRNDSNGVLSILSVIFLLIWAMWELKSGVNYFRKVLGGVIIISTLIGLLF